MLTRRAFMKQAAVLAGAAGLGHELTDSILRAAAIEPALGSSYLDAEHVVILMQENRSFDHAFGTLRGVRGFNDRRAITLPDGNPVWVQADTDTKHYVPFRLDIKRSKATWMGSLPHGWTDQTDARHDGLHDRWIPAKRSGHREYAAIPMTMGYFTREDIPFYYALADAFTICDQHFCSTLTGTTPNRLHLWTGTIREKQSADAPANVRNEDVDYGRWASWTTFPERLEELGISWKCYQNELTLESGFNENEDAWLANFGDNPLEWFTQYEVSFAAPHRKFVERRLKEIPGEIEILRTNLEKSNGSSADAGRIKKELAKLTAALDRYRVEHTHYTELNYDKLAARVKALHERAFCTNVADPTYRRLTELSYRDGVRTQRIPMPEGDVLHQFRAEVAAGALPTVSWIVAPERFSDHPSSAWYGAWYIAEVLNILTSNPAVWKKTVFILTYDENDGYFDHVPPFTAPHPKRPDTGLASKGIDTGLEQHDLVEDLKRHPPGQARGGPIGLGYRVPMIIASPWTRGGCVCSQVFDHTSVIQFLEQLLTHKTGKTVSETNINRWRRTVCGNLTSAFQDTYDTGAGPPFPSRDSFLEEIHRAQFTPLPAGYHALSADEIEQVRHHPRSSPLPRQESGVRRSCPLPYELSANGHLNDERTRFQIAFEAKADRFGPRSAGAAFIAYAFTAPGVVRVRNYAVEAGDRLEDSWPLTVFENGRYDLRIYGPNGFFRAFTGGADDLPLDVSVVPGAVRTKNGELPGRVEIRLANRDSLQGHTIEIRDNSYGAAEIRKLVSAGERTTLVVETGRSFGWYDFSIRVLEGRAEQQYAGRIETGEWGFSDPAMVREDR
jgi:phospholipase C